MNSRNVWYRGVSIVLGLLLSAAVPGRAVTGSWTYDGSDAWTNPARWGGNLPNVAGDIAYLTNNIGANRTITNDAPVTIGHLWIGDATGTSVFNLLSTNNQVLTFDNNGAAATVNKTKGGADTLNVRVALTDDLIVSNLSASSLSFNGTISGAYRSLTKVGTGLVMLNATNTYSGATIVNEGTLRLMDSRWIDASRYISLNGGVLEIVSNNLARSGGLGLGAAQIQIPGGVSGFSISGNGDRTVTIGAGGSSLLWGSTFFNPAIFILNTTGANRQIYLDNAIDLNGADREIDVVSNMGTLSRPVTNGSAFAAGLVKAGAGTLNLNAANNYDGTTTVLNGALRVSNIGGLSTNNTLILNGGLLEFAIDHPYQNPVLGTGAGTVQFAGAAGFGANNGTRTVNVNGTGATLVMGAGSLANWGALLLNGPSSAGRVNLANGIDLNGAARTVSVAAAVAQINGIVTNSAGTPALLEKTGGGILLVTGDNYRHDGGTLIRAGTIQLGDYWGRDGVLPGLAGNAGGLLSTGGVLWVANRLPTTLSGNIAGTGELIMAGPDGYLTLTGTNRYNGNTRVRRGTLELDFSAAGAPTTNIIGVSTMSPLILGEAGYSGGRLRLVGGVFTDQAQVFRSLAVNPGDSEIELVNGAGGTMNLMVSNITRSVGGAVDFTLPSAGLIRTVFTNVNGVIPGATVGGTDWATALGAAIPRQITNLTAYTVLAGAGPVIADGYTQNVKIDATSSGAATLAAATTTIQTLLASDASARTINLAGQTLRLGTVGGVLQPATSGGLTIGSAANDGFLTAGTNANVAGELLLINHSANPLVINSAIASNGTAAIALTKSGAGTVNLAGTNKLGAVNVNDGALNLLADHSLGAVTVVGGSLVFGSGGSHTLGGTLLINGGSVSINGPVTSGSELQMNSVSGARSVLYIATNLTASRIRAAVGDNSFAAGAIFQTGGIVLGTTASSGLSVCDGNGNYGYYGLSGGVVTGDVIVAYRGPGVFEQRGGVVSPNNQFQVVSGSGSGTVNLYGGLFLAPATAAGYLPMQGTASAGGTAVINVLGGELDASYGGTAKAIDLMNQPGNTSYLNLNVGVVTANQVKATQPIGNSVFNLNGGTLVAAAGSTVSRAFVSGLSAAYVYAGGATIDTPGTNAPTFILTGLQAPSGFGLASIATNANCGGGYIGAPIVQILGGSGTGAMAVAQVDFATGFITNFLVVNPGTGYQAADTLTVALNGGGPLTAPTNFTVSGAALAANASGGLTKNGAGLLVLAGTNTYTGPTAVNAGLLDAVYPLANPAGITLAAGAGMAFGVGGANTWTELAITNLLATKFAASNSFGLDTTAGGATWSPALAGFTDFYKLGQNTLIVPTAAGYTGNTYVLGGALRAEWGTGLPNTSHLVLNGGAWETASGTAGNWGAGAGQFEIPGGTSGFSAVTSPLIVDLGGSGAPVTWDTGFFHPEAFVLNAPSADTNLVLVNELDLAGGSRTIVVGAQTAFLAGGLTNTLFASGQGGLVKMGAGTLVLSNESAVLNLQANPGLMVREGTLRMTGGSLWSQSPANNNDYVGRFAGDDGTLILAGTATYLRSNNYLVVGNDLGCRGTFVVQDNATFWGNYRLMLGNNVGSTGLVFQTGGTVTLGSDTYIGDDGYGRYELSGGILSNANTYIGNNNTSIGMLLQSGGVFRATGTTTIGNNNGASGAYIQLGGTYSGGGQLSLAGTPNAYGYFEMKGGTRTNSNWIQVGNQGIGGYYQSGGTNWVTGSGMLLNNGNGTAIGFAYISGGVYTSAYPLMLGYNNAPSGIGRAEFNLDGGSFLLSSYVMMNRNGGAEVDVSTNILNLRAGTLRANAVSNGIAGGLNVLNFDGGTLLAGANNVALVQGLDAAYVHSGGAVIDTAANNVSIPQNLVAPSGQGVVALPWGGNLAGYIGAPYVKIEGGSGFGATAVALFDYASGTVTGLVLTSAGSGYAPGDTVSVSLVGGGDTVTLGGATLGAVGSGGLTKLGTGALLLTGANTYTGQTIVAEGALEALYLASLPGGTNLVVQNGGTFIAGVGGAGQWQAPNLDGLLDAGSFQPGSAIGFDTAGGDFTYATAVTGAIGLAKIGTNTLTLSGANTYGGGTRILGGTLVLDANQGLGAGPLEIGAPGSAASLTLSNVSQTVSGMLVRSTSAADNFIHIGAGQSLVVLGNVTNGAAVDGVTRTIVDGAGSWAVTNLGGSFQVALITNGIAFLDLRTLGRFDAALGSGVFRLGQNQLLNGTSTSTVWLATNSTISAGIIGVGDAVQHTVGRSSLRLGPGESVFYTDNLLIGGGKQYTELVFDTATGTLAVSNLAGTGRANAAVGVNWAGTGASPNGMLDLRGHEVSLFLGSVTNGGRTSSLSGNGAGYIYFDTGVLDASSLIVGIRGGSSSGVMTGEVHVGGGTVNLGSVELARNTVPSNNATFGLLDLYGGTVTMSGNIFKGGGAGPATAALWMTNSATLDMGGFAIGDAVNPIDSLRLESGTLRNVAEINGGGNWTKAGAGRLTLDGNNGFGGAVTVSTGVLAAVSATALGTTGGGVIVLPGGTLGLQGGITIAGETLLMTGIGAIDGATTNAGALRNISGTNTWAGDITVTGSVDTALFSEEGHLVISGNIIDNRTGGNLLLRGNGSGEISGSISGARSLFKSASGATNAGLWILSGANTYLGGTTIAAGTLQVSSEANLGTTPAAFVAGQLSLRGGMLQTTASMTISTNRGVSVGTLGGGFDTAAGTLLTVQSVISGTVNTNPLIKTGAGTLLLEAANTYTGPTLVSNGTLRVNGSHTGGGLITVFNGGWLAGTGTVGNVAVAAGGALQPGNSAGTLTVADLTLDADALLEYELGVANDLILAGAVALGGIEFANFNFIPDGGFGPGEYPLIDATSISGLGSATNGAVGGYPAALWIDADNQDLMLTVIPEPAAVAAFGFVVLAALLRRRARRG